MTSGLYRHPLRLRLYEGETSAIYGPGGRDASEYRYSLHRRWSDVPPEVWLMCNPSKATELKLDATVRRVRNFSMAWGAGGFVVVNAYALRSTNPKGLKLVADPVGLINDVAIEQAFELTHETQAGRRFQPPRAPRVMAAWGAVGESAPKWPARLAAIQALADHVGVELHVLNLTEKGATPVHPLRRPKNELPRLWRSPA